MGGGSCRYNELGSHEVVKTEAEKGAKGGGQGLGQGLGQGRIWKAEKRKTITS